jgi:hypothetical protein
LGSRRKMPKIILSIDEYFDREKKDLYFIRILDEDKQDDLFDWFKKNLPNTKFEEIMIKSYRLGYELASWENDWVVYFDKDGLDLYIKTFEDEIGNSREKGFQCFLHTLSMYNDQVKSFNHPEDNE